jgi:hypothetical protein
MISETDWLGDATASPAPNPGGRPAKGYRGRQRKLGCPDCGFACYVTALAVERYGFPRCACGGSMSWANQRDRLILEPAELVQDIGEDRFRVLCHEHGYADLADHYAPVKRDRQSGDGSARCQWAGGYCMTIVSGQYCAEHEPTRYGV